MLFKISCILNIGCIFLLCGCSLFQRSAGSGLAYEYYGATKPKPLTQQEINKNAAELGINPNQSLSDEQLYSIQGRQMVRELEQKLSSKKEKDQYSRILPLLQGDPEKIQFLSIPSIEGRQAWINRNNIWQRGASVNPDLYEAAESGDLALGMTEELVRRSWGEPQSVDVSGNPSYRNQKWKYSRNVASDQGYRTQNRYVYFEGGRVVGWETE